MILAKSQGGHPDRPYHAAGQIGLPADIVIHPARFGIEKQAVDREIPPLGVFLGGGKGHARRMPAVCIGGVGAEGGHLHMAGLPWANHGDHPKGGPHGERPPLAEKEPHRGGLRRSGNVVVSGHSAEQFIAHAPPGPQRLMPRRAQPPHHVSGEISAHSGIGRNGWHQIKNLREFG